MSIEDVSTDEIMQHGKLIEFGCDLDFEEMTNGLLVASASPSRPESVPAAVKLRDQLDARFPNRSKASDGWIGDAAHRARKSYHNPDHNGWVHARDITHDPREGMDIARITQELAASRDPRILELICNDRYLGPGTNWGWKNYSGSNPHTKHFHISIRPGTHAMDSRPWNLPILGGTGGSTPAPSTTSTGSGYKVIQRGSSDKVAVAKLQRALDIEDDGIFGPQTEYWVRYYQRSKNLTVDGIAGEQTQRSMGIRL